MKYYNIHSVILLMQGMHEVCIIYTIAVYIQCSYAGMHELCVATWRPSGSAVVEQLRRFFVGGETTRLCDISYISTPPDIEVRITQCAQHTRIIVVQCEIQGRYLSKYGFQTKSSGTVNFRFSMVHQSWYMDQFQLCIHLKFFHWFKAQVY